MMNTKVTNLREMDVVVSIKVENALLLCECLKSAAVSCPLSTRSGHEKGEDRDIGLSSPMSDTSLLSPKLNRGTLWSLPDPRIVAHCILR